MTNRNFYYDLSVGANKPKPSHGLSGSQFGSSQDSVAGKRPTDGPPIIINTTPVGTNMQDDGMWVTSYGASHDAFLTIVPGAKVQDSIDSLQITSVYKDGLPNADDDNLWRKAGDVQQIQFIASKNTVAEYEDAADSYGDVSEARGLGLRIPGMAGGWGRTIDLLPTDPEPTTDPNGRKNDEEHKLARETWKFGPLDARWDYRRNVWATYNDLIADHYDQQLGTWVFGTNPDISAGFPLLRGRLDDAFWVRQPLDFAGRNGRSEGVQTGRLMTHLEHEWYDNDENGSAPLNSIFIIPHTNSTSDCHAKEGEHTLGPEITGDSMKIDIKTSVHFFKEPGIDAQIKFGRKVDELQEICCEPDPNANWFMGEMIFVPKDYQRENCNGDPTDIPLDEDGNVIGECEWVPAIQIDECQLVGEHFVTLVDNDQQVALMVCSLCDEIKTWAGVLINVIANNDSVLASRINNTQLALDSLAKQVEACIVTAITVAQNLACQKVEELEKKFDQLIDAIFGTATINDGEMNQSPGLTGQINETLNECIGKEEFLPATEIVDGNNIAIGEEGFNPDTAKVKHGFIPVCPIGGVAFPSPFSCNFNIDFGTTSNLETPDPFDNCPTVDLQLPCGEPEDFTIDCDNPMPQILSTDYGKCQAHEG